MDEEESSFDRFTRIFSEYPEIVKESPAYRLIVTEFGIPFTAKLVATALAGPSRDSRKHAAVVIKEMTKTDLIRNAYLNIRHQTLNSFRQCALHLMVSKEAGSDLQRCGLLLTADLLNSSLQYNETGDRSWTELREMTERGFSEQQPNLLEFVLDVFCELRDENMERFVRSLEPCIITHRDQFIERLMNLLRRGQVDCCGVYILIPSLYHFVSERSYRRLLREAIHSRFFNNVHGRHGDHDKSRKRACAAENLKRSIEITPTHFDYPKEWKDASDNVIGTLLLHSTTHRERVAATQLLDVFIARGLDDDDGNDDN